MREKILKFKQIISIPLIIAIFAFIILNFIVVSAISDQMNKSNECFRVHIVANSNNGEDQKLKYAIKAKIQEYVKENITLFCTNDKESFKASIEKNLDKILDISKNTIKELGFNYDVKAKVGKINYETKLSNYYSMSAGNYDALEIEIGDANGKNFWSVIYNGSLSIPQEYYELVDNASFENTYDSNVNNITFDFKIMEIINNLFNL